MYLLDGLILLAETLTLGPSVSSLMYMSSCSRKNPFAEYHLCRIKPRKNVLRGFFTWKAFFSPKRFLGRDVI